MKKLFIVCLSRREAQNAMPWAIKIAKVDGGYMGFESIDDYITWKNQK
jgi:hypothetical protein